MKHSNDIFCAQFRKRLNDLGLALRMDQHGVQIGKDFGAVFSVEKTFATLYNAWLWVNDEAINKPA